MRSKSKASTAEVRDILKRMKEEWDESQKSPIPDRTHYREGSVLRQAAPSTPRASQPPPPSTPRASQRIPTSAAGTPHVSSSRRAHEQTCNTPIHPRHNHRARSPTPSATTTLSTHTFTTTTSTGSLSDSREGLPYDSDEDYFDDSGLMDSESFLEQTSRPLVRKVQTLNTVLATVYLGAVEDRPIIYSGGTFMGSEVLRYFKAHGYVEIALRKTEEVYRRACEGHNIEGSFVALLAAEGMPADTARYIFSLVRQNRNA